MTATDLVIVVASVALFGGAIVFGLWVARRSQQDRASDVAAIYRHIAGVAERSGLSITPGPGEVTPGMWGEIRGFMVRVSTALTEDMVCEIAVEAPASVRWRPQQAIHRTPPPGLSPAGQAALERLGRRVRRLDVEAGALRCSLVSIEVLVPGMPELLDDLVTLAGELPRA